MPPEASPLNASRFCKLGAAMCAVALTAGCARPPADPQSPIDMRRVRQYVKELSEKIGPRPAGSKQADEAATWIARRLALMGYGATTTSMRLPNGRNGANVEARTPVRGKRLLLAAHFDTVEGCYCASDDATGVALLLEIARLAKTQEKPVPLTFLFLGAEEELPGGVRQFSADQWLRRVMPGEQAETAGCLVLDKLGRGKRFTILQMQGTPILAAQLCADVGADLRPRPRLTTVERWFPRMPFEDAGIPTAWIEWWPDPHAHAPRDTWDKIHWSKVELAGLLAWRAVLSQRWRD